MTQQVIMAEIVAEATEKPVDPLEGFFIVANWRGQWWRVFSTIYASLEAARREAERLPSGWRKRTIVRVVIKP